MEIPIEDPSTLFDILDPQATDRQCLEDFVLVMGVVVLFVSTKARGRTP